MTKSEAIQEFINFNNVAVVGVSRKGKFGNAIYKEMKEKGINVFAVNPYMQEFKGDKCYSNVGEIPELVDGAIIAVAKDKCLDAVRSTTETDIKSIWLQQGSFSKEAASYCREKGVTTIDNECIMMFLEPVKHIHSFHRWIWKLIGKYPN